jgi:hypothetical protein
MGLFSRKRIRGRAAGASDRDRGSRELPVTSPPCSETLTRIFHRAALSHKLTKEPDWGMTGNYPHPARDEAAADRAGAAAAVRQPAEPTEGKHGEEAAERRRDPFREFAGARRYLVEWLRMPLMAA